MLAVRIQLAALGVVALAACAGNQSEGSAGDDARERAPQNPLLAMQSESARHDPRAQIFLAKGCPQCHQIIKLEVVSPTNVGPDLSHAVRDVRQRFNTSLDSFLINPTGTMQIVLSGQITLTPAERDSISRLLRDLSTNP